MLNMFQIIGDLYRDGIDLLGCISGHGNQGE